MNVKRTEAEVAGHDPELRASLDELASRPRGGAAPAPASTGDAEFDPHRFQSQSVPPAMLAAMAAVDLRKVDAREQTPPVPSDARQKQPPDSPGRRLLGNALLAVAVVSLLLGAVLLFGWLRKPVATPAAQPGPSAVIPSASPEPPASQPAAPSAATSTTPLAPMRSAPPRSTSRDPNRDPDRPVL